MSIVSIDFFPRPVDKIRIFFFLLNDTEFAFFLLRFFDEIQDFFSATD